MKILLLGSSGHMGQMLIPYLLEQYEVFLYDVGTILEESQYSSFDACIDFSHAALSLKLLPTLLAYHIPIVTGTTGYDQTEMIQLAKQYHTSFIYLPSYVEGIYHLIEGIPIYKKNTIQTILEETHDITKKDSPSGTSITLSTYLDIPQTAILSYRVQGANPTHKITFIYPHETITIIHETKARESYAPMILKALNLILKQKEIHISSYEDWACHFIDK